MAYFPSGTAEQYDALAGELAGAPEPEGRIGFVDIVDSIARVIDAHTGRESDASTVEGVLDADAWAREQAAGELGL